MAQLDPGQLEAQRLRATHTPQAVVVAQTRVVYRGRIDDRYVSWGRSRPQPTQRDLQRALENILAGRAVPAPWPTPVGCLIER